MSKTTLARRARRAAAPGRWVAGALAVGALMVLGAAGGSTAAASAESEAAEVPPPLPAPDAPPRAEAKTSAPIVVAPAATTDWADLEARVAREGSVRVVVELEPRIRARSRAEHRLNLRHTRDRLLGEFAGRKPRGLNAMEGSPIVAFEADARDLQRLRRSPNVKRVTVDGVHDAVAAVPNGAQNGVQLQQWWDYARIGADWANNNGYTGAGRYVVVIDSGVDRTHGWLTGRVTTEACFATNTNGTGACPGGKTYSYNATRTGVAGAAAPCSYVVDCAHGTHVAHTAAGAYGVARGAGIVAIQASHPEWDAKRGVWVPRYRDSDIINALWYVYEILPFWPDAVNMSIGGGYTASCDSAVPQVTSYINALKAAGVATVIASGNDDYTNAVSWPGCISNAITVGNTTLDAAGVDAVLGYTGGGSNSSASVDLLAPGTDICSAFPVGLDVTDGVKDGVVCDWYGTSMAAPHVAGAIAQIRQSRPTATVDQILAALQRRGTAVTDSRNGIVRSRINVAMTIYYF